jgi:endonuclease YncB( thermonuclease family)
MRVRVPTLILLALLLVASAPPLVRTAVAEPAPATIVRVVDGDTIDVQVAVGHTERLRLIGIDTPETVDPRKPVQCFGREASAHAHELLDGQTVTLDGDPTQDTRDRYVRLAVYVWLADGSLVEVELRLGRTVFLPSRAQAGVANQGSGTVTTSGWLRYRPGWREAAGI